MWSSKYVAGEPSEAQKGKCGVLCRGELCSDAAALVCLKRSDCSVWANLQVPVLPFVLTNSPSLPPAPPCALSDVSSTLYLSYTVMLTASK